MSKFSSGIFSLSEDFMINQLKLIFPTNCWSNHDRAQTSNHDFTWFTFFTGFADDTFDVIKMSHSKKKLCKKNLTNLVKSLKKKCTLWGVWGMFFLTLIECAIFSDKNICSLCLLFIKVIRNVCFKY